METFPEFLRLFRHDLRILKVKVITIYDDSDGDKTTELVVDTELDEGNGDLSAETCWICFTGSHEAVLLPCGHGGICMKCAERCCEARPRVCPLCRERVVSAYKLEPTSSPGLFVRRDTSDDFDSNRTNLNS